MLLSLTLASAEPEQVGLTIDPELLQRITQIYVDNQRAGGASLMKPPLTGRLSGGYSGSESQGFSNLGLDSTLAIGGNPFKIEEIQFAPLVTDFPYNGVNPGGFGDETRPLKNGGYRAEKLTSSGNSYGTPSNLQTQKRGGEGYNGSGRFGDDFP